MEELEEEDEEEGTGHPGRPWRLGRRRSKYWAHEDQRDELSGIREVVRDEFSKLFRIRGEKRDGFRNIYEERRNGWNTCKNRKRMSDEQRKKQVRRARVEGDAKLEFMREGKECREVRAHGELFLYLIQKEPATMLDSETFSPWFTSDLRTSFFSADVLSACTK